VEVHKAASGVFVEILSNLSVTWNGAIVLLAGGDLDVCYRGDTRGCIDTKKSGKEMKCMGEQIVAQTGGKRKGAEERRREERKQTKGTEGRVSKQESAVREAKKKGSGHTGHGVNEREWCHKVVCLLFADGGRE